MTAPARTTSVRDYRSYLAHGCRYRPVDFQHQWEPSPVTPTASLPVTMMEKSQSTPKTITINWNWERRSTEHEPFFIRAIHRFLNRLTKKKLERLEIQLMDPDELAPPPSPPIPLSEWKAWGYYAYPVISGGHVRNLSPGPEVAEVDPENLAATLTSPGGRHHPERWINGLKHPALPPRPTRWVRPRETDPLPFPRECQLNPFLAHCQFGQAPILWDVGLDLDTILFNTEDEICIPLGRADSFQPATWPFVTHMCINAVSDDPTPKFPWPMLIRNASGIKCQDVFVGIHDNFQEYVSREELALFSWVRREQAFRALEMRRRAQELRGEEPDRWLRRIDYFGMHVMFRGLEPNPNCEGWILFMGLG